MKRKATDKERKVRTKGGICLGEQVPVNGKRGVRMAQGKKEECLLPEDFVEAVTGRKVAVIIYKDDFNQSEELPKMEML